MKRALAAAAALWMAAGCSTSPGPTSHATPTAAGGVCPKLPTVLQAGAALMHDVAAGAGEYGYGRPGETPAVVHLRDLGGPVPGRDELFGTVTQGGHPVTVAIGAAGCRRVAPGSVFTVSPDGSEAVVQSPDASYRLVETATGRQLAGFAEAALYWTGDGHLVVQRAANSLAVYDGGGAEHTIGATGQLSGSLGASEAIVVTVQATVLVDVLSGASRTLASRRLFLPAGSPDGRWVAGVDLTTGAAEVIDVSTRRITPVNVHAQIYSMVWSRDSRLLAVNGAYGGYVLQAGSWQAASLGAYDVVSF